MLIKHLAATNAKLLQLGVQASCLSPNLFVKASLACFIIALFSTTVADYANCTYSSHRRWIFPTECPSLLPEPWPLCQSITGQFYHCFFFQQQLRIILIIYLAATDIELFQMSVQASCLSRDLFVKASLANFIIALFSTTVADYANHTSCSHRCWIVPTECPSLLPEPWPFCQSITGQFYYCFIFNNSWGIC